MKLLNPPPTAPHLPDRLRERVASLQLAIVVVQPGAAPQATGPLGPLERLLLSSTPLFRRQVEAVWERLTGGGMTRIWPGVHLIPLADGRRRGGARAWPALPAVLLVGRAFLKSDQFRLVCDAAGVDARATRSQVDAAALVDEPEATRLATMLAWLRDDAAEADRRVLDLQGMSRELANSYEELSLLYQLAAGMGVDQPPEDFLHHACLELQQVVDLDWLALQLVNDEPRLDHLSGRCFLAGDPGAGADTMEALGADLIGRFGGSPRPVVIDDAAAAGLGLAPPGVKSVLVVPLRQEGRPLGILFGGCGPGQQITSREATLCDSLASNLAIFLQNAMLYEDVQAMFLGTLHALTSAIDAKDSYTRGHSERVARVSKMLATQAGLPADTCERIYLAGLVHDVGKIGVPEAVLCKPGRLSPEEFGAIKRHPEIGAHILRGIRQMNDLIPGVLHHHERWDGKGYPSGLAGHDVPLFGRVIALADAFDAMCSDRTYRSAREPAVALEEVRRGAGSQFDPELAATFVRLDFTDYLALQPRPPVALCG